MRPLLNDDTCLPFNTEAADDNNNNNFGKYILFCTLHKHQLTRLYDRGLKGAESRCFAARSYCDLSSCQPVLRDRILCMTPVTWDGHNTPRYGRTVLVALTVTEGLAGSARIDALTVNKFVFFTISSCCYSYSRTVQYCEGSPCAAVQRMRKAARVHKRTSGRSAGNSDRPF